MNEQAPIQVAGRHGASSVSSIELKPSERSTRIRYAIRDIMLLAEQAKAAGKELVRLNIGDPILYDFQTPRHIIEATYRAMLAGHNGYAPSLGVEEAVEAIRREANSRGVRNIQEIFVTSGVSEGIEVSMAALLDPGDNMLIPAPGYPLYEATLAKLGCMPVYYHLDEANAWQPDVGEMAKLVNSRTRGIVVMNPNNPTGAICRKELLKEILNLAARHGLVAVSDEIYDKLLFDESEYVPLASLAPDQPVVTFNGLSKAYLVPGFRTGWGILSGHEQEVAAYREAIAKMLRVRLCSNQPSQFAVRPALEGDQSHIALMVEKLKKRRDLAMSLLTSIPNVSCFTPQAAFYAFPRLEISRTDQEFVADLIRQTGVIVVPGSGFGQQPGTKHFRMVFLPPEETLRKAIGRISDFARNWNQ
ncbi:MAG: aminotransferase class I/II-fold pyridoxal phosphate-dependent enzyme [Acidobacteria bacterium]|nr:aminotransferase class I/II-fold pyridoxal phosphate-dependent enzyme [Acidobacteriota bacterium]